MIQGTLLRIAAMAYFWSLCHDVSIFLFESILSLLSYDYYGPQGIKENLEALKVEATQSRAGARRLGNMKRLIRSQIYCTFAACSGIYIFYNEYEKIPKDLLHHWGPYHEFVFEMACGHWLFSILEDYLVGSEVISHMILLESERAKQYGYMLNGLIAHHIFTLFAYGWCLSTHKLSGLCIFGLMFETPILLLNARDLWACFEKELLRPFRNMTRGNVHVFFGLFYLLWHLFRTIPCVLYPLSLLIWRPQLATLPIYSRYVYHILGVLFCYVNYELIFGVIPRVILDDWMRAGLISQESHLHNMRVYAGEIYEDGTERTNKKKDMSEEYIFDVESQNNKKSSKVGVRMLGMEAVKAHNSPSDCWIALDGNVYDLTEFAEIHPGGAQVLHEVAGKDASAEFLAVGHSMKARKMMSQYIVGQILGHAYEQSNDVPVDNKRPGDFSKPFEIGRMYTTWENTSILTVVASGFVLFVLQCAVHYSKPNSKASSFLSGNVFSSYNSIAVLVGLSTVFLLVLHRLSSKWSRVAEGQMGITAPLRPRSCLSQVSDWRAHGFAIALLLYLYAESAVLSIKYGHSFRAARVSILLTSALEVAWGAFGPVVLPRRSAFLVVLRYIPAACLLLAGGLDLSATSAAISKSYRDHHEEAFPSHVFNSSEVFFSVCILMCSLLRFVFVRLAQPTRNEALDTNVMFARHVLSLFYLTLALFICPSDWLIRKESMLEFLIKQDVTSWWILFACALSLAVFLCSMSKLTSTSTCYFASQSYCICMLFLIWTFSPSVNGARWVCFLLFLMAMAALSYEAEVTLEMLGAEAPNWIYHAKQIENMFRHNLSLALHSFVTMPFNRLNSILSPKSQMYFTFPGPVMDLGPNCEYGMCYQITPPYQQKPELFQVNVGYIGGEIGDYMHTASATKLMMQGLADDRESGKKGFVTNMVAHFFIPEKSPARKYGDYRVREVNLSGWASDEAAHKWYKESDVHKEIVKKYYGGGLEGFSAMLASLKPPPDRPIRWDVRCRKCRYLIKGPYPGDCPHCGSHVPPMPYF